MLTIPCWGDAASRRGGMVGGARDRRHVGASGPDVLAAVVAGYETTIRIGLAMQPSHFKRGFQSTGTCNVFGTAGRRPATVPRRDAQQRIQEAIGLAGSYPSGVAQFYYSGSSASASRPRTPRRAASLQLC